MGDKWNVYRLLVEKREGRKPLGKPERGRVDHDGWIMGREELRVVWTGLVWLRIGTSGGL
jgi:hypothetical protein